MQKHFPYLLLIVVSILVSLSQIKSKLTEEKVLIAINCGGISLIDSKGIIYQKVKLKFLVNKK